MNTKRLRANIKRANTRLASLQKQKYNTPALRHIEQLYYDNNYLIEKSKSGNIKFKTSLSFLDDKSLKELNKIVNDFLETKTSTITGVKTMYKKSYETYKERYGYNGTLQDYMDIFDSVYLKEYQNRYGSRELAKLINQNDFDITNLIAKEIYEENIRRDMLGLRELSLIELNNLKTSYKNPFGG